MGEVLIHRTMRRNLGDVMTHDESQMQNTESSKTGKTNLSGRNQKGDDPGRCTGLGNRVQGFPELDAEGGVRARSCSEGTDASLNVCTMLLDGITVNRKGISGGLA